MEKVSSLFFSQGCVHDYHGMRINYGTKGMVHITMPKHIKSIIKAEADNMEGIAETSEANHIFAVREYGDTLTGMQADLLQTFVAKILFVSCQSSPNLKTALDFLTMWLRNPYGYYYKKIARTIRYTRAMWGMDLNLEVDSIDTIWWRINAKYSVHPDLKGYFGGMMLLGKGAAARKLIRHRINSRRSTRSEIIWVDDHMPGVLWTLSLLGGQGFKVNKNIVYQNNHSAILMERNRKY